jgi:AraC-like DNA-binding protein
VAQDSPAEANVPERRWNVENLHPGDRFDAWSEIVSRTHLAFALDRAECSAQSGGFLVDVQERRLGQLSLLDTSVAPHRGRRTRRLVSANTRDVIGFHFIRRGSQSVDIDGERVVLGPGDAMFWDGESTGTYEILEPLEKTTLIVPRVIAAAALPAYRRSFVRILPRDHASTRTLIDVLTVLGARLPLMSEGARHAAATLVAQLLSSLDGAAGAAGDEHGAGARTRWELRERALRYIEEHLQDPTLGMATVAAAHAVSRRTLYAALDGLSMTPGAYIRNRRLARCHDELLHGDDPIALVAARWGFASAAHFSRVFQQRYGIPPSRLRRGSAPPDTVDRRNIER